MLKKFLFGTVIALMFLGVDVSPADAQPNYENYYCGGNGCYDDGSCYDSDYGNARPNYCGYGRGRGCC